MNAAHLRAAAKEKDAQARWLAERNPVFHRLAIRRLNIEASGLRSQAMELEQKEAA